MKALLPITLLFFAHMAAAQVDSVIYGLINKAGGGELAKINPATGVVTKISSAPVYSIFRTEAPVIDPQKQVFYYPSYEENFTGMDLLSGEVVSNPPINNPLGHFTLDGLQFNFLNSEIFCHARTSSPDEAYLAKINPETGEVSHISSTSITSSPEINCKALDPFNKVYYIATPGRFIGIDISTGAIVRDISSTGDTCHTFNFNPKNKMVYGIYSNGVEGVLMNIDPNTGIAQKGASIPPNGTVMHSTLDPDKNLLYYRNSTGLIIVDLSTGQYSTKPIVGSTGFFSNYIYNYRHLAPTSIEKPSLQQGPGVFPNPTNGVFYLKTSHARDVSVFNSMGKMVFKATEAKKIDLSGMAKGCYFLTYWDNGNPVRERIILVN